MPRTTHPAAREELRQFLASRGHHPQAGLAAFLDGLQFNAHSRTQAARCWRPPPAGS